jgi:hypothetical protein
MGLVGLVEFGKIGLSWTELDWAESGRVCRGIHTFTPRLLQVLIPLPSHPFRRGVIRSSAPHDAAC